MNRTNGKVIEGTGKLLLFPVPIKNERPAPSVWGPIKAIIAITIVVALTQLGVFVRILELLGGNK